MPSLAQQHCGSIGEKVPLVKGNSTPSPLPKLRRTVPLPWGTGDFREATLNELEPI